MEFSPLGCQVCLTKYRKVCKLKKHFYSQPHQQKMLEIFGKAAPNCRGSIPYIVLFDSITKRDKQPIKGLSLLTVCFTRGSESKFYLCHICEEKCPQESIMYHLSTGDHSSNYFNYTDPNVLHFCWIPKKDMRAILRTQFAKEVEEGDLGTLQVLELPKNLCKTLERSTYSEVMHTLKENGKLNKCLKAVKPKRTMIQTYQRDSNRKNPLLGMQHIVECICDGPTEKKYYLCTLCKLTLATHMIIKHVLSFDHVYNYFKAWHPSTLASKESYKDYNESVMLSLAKQTLEIFGAPSNEMKQVSLEASEFASVNFTCYEEALKRLEAITKENKGITLITSIKPGAALEVEAPCCTLSVVLTCQDCSMTFGNIHAYLDHLSKWKHNQMLNKIFREANRAPGYANGGSKPHLGLYRYLKRNLIQNEPVIGVSLVVACINTEVHTETIYVCFACQDSFPESVLLEHFKCIKHLIHTMPPHCSFGSSTSPLMLGSGTLFDVLYHNPWQLPFAWETALDVTDLRSKAWEEEKERAPNQMTMKVLDVPYLIFCSLIPPTYEKVMKRLELQHSVIKRDVPRRETYSKLQKNERFPLLGQQFIVMYSVEQNQSTKVAFLCLLCARKLSDTECHAHVFSREHVENFLDRQHPGTLTSGINAETLMDLAKQAGRINPISTVQVMKLDSPIWEPCPYYRAICILASAKRRDKKGALEPSIKAKMKLVPRETVKKLDKDHVTDNSQNHSKMIEGSENKTSQTSTDNSDTIMKKIAVEVSTLNTNKEYIKSEEDGGKGANKDTLAPSDQQSEEKKKCPETRSEKIKSSRSDTCQVIKEEKTEKPVTTKPSGEIPGSCQNTDKDDEAETRKESKNSKDVLTECKNYMYYKNEKGRLDIKSEKSETDICPDEDVGREMGHKRQQLTSKEGTCFEKPQKMHSSGLKQETSVDQAKRGKPSHETAKDKAPPDANQQSVEQLWQYVKRKRREPVVGLNKLLECHCHQHDTIYLCECCSEKIPEKNIISHVTGFSHQKMYLEELQKLPTLSRMHQMEEIRHLAVESECANGFGKTQVVELDEKVYCNILLQDFKSAIQSVKSLQGQQESRHELPLASILPSGQHVNTLVILHNQHEAHSTKDNIQVVKMEIDNDSEDPEIWPSPITAAMSAVPETSSKSTEVHPKSTKDITFAHSKVPDSADNAVPRSGDKVSKSGTNTTILHLDCTEKISKDDIAERTSVEPLKKANTSVGTFQTAATSAGAALKVTVTASNSKTASKVVCEATQTTAPSSKIENASKHSETVSGAAVTLQTLATPVAAAKIAKAPVKCENTEQSAKTLPIKHLNVDVAPHVHKSNPSATTPSTAPVSVRGEHTGLSSYKVGVSQLIVVLCQRSQQVYCQLCSVRLIKSSHTSTEVHQYNYVKMKYPEWTAKPSESKLEKIVAHLAEVEKDIECRGQIIHVNMDEYRELAALPENIAVEKLKAKIAKGASSILPTSTTDSADALRQQVGFTSPCEVSSPNNEIYLPQNEMSGFSTNHQPEQENKHKPQSWTDKTPEVNDVNPGQLHSRPGSIQNFENPIPASSIQEPDIAVTITQETFEANVETEAHVTPVFQSHGVQVEKYGCVDPLAATTESASTLAQNLSICQETSENGHQKERSDPDTQKTSHPMSSSADTISSGALVNTEQQNQLRPSHKTEHVSTCSGYRAEPGQHSDSQMLPRISIGESTQGRSNLSRFLAAMKLDKQIIGLGSVWECRGISQGMSQNTFYLCESCRKTLSVNHICHHMASSAHISNCMMTQYPQFAYFLEVKSVPEEAKLDILMGIAEMLSEQERFKNMDAQVLMLSHELHERVQKASFSEALEIVQNIKEQRKLRVFCQPVNTLQQKNKQPENRQSQKPSLQMEMQPTVGLETHHEKAREETEKHLEETAMVRDLEGVKRKKVLHPLDVNSVSSKAEPMASPILFADTCVSPQGTNGSLSVQPELRPTVTLTELQVKQAEVDSPSLFTVSPKTTQILSLSPKDKRITSRKRPALTAVETLSTSSFTSNPELEGPLQAKCARISLQPESQSSHEIALESKFVNPSATAAPLCSKEKGTGPEYDGQNAPNKDWNNYGLLAALLKEVKLKVVQQRLDSKCGQTESKKAKTRWDSRCQMIKVTKMSTSSKSLEEVSTADTLQHQSSGSAQSMFGNVSHLQPSSVYTVATNNDTDHIPQPQSNVGTDNTRICQMPINAIITARPDPIKKQSVGDYKGQIHSELNKGIEIPHHLPTVTTATTTTPTDNLAASGGYGHCSQRAFITAGPLSYRSSETVAGYTTPDNLPVYIDSLYHMENYNTRDLYPSQAFSEQESMQFNLQSSGYSLATPTPPAWMSQEMQQQQLMMVMMQQQQQYPSCTSAAFPAANDKVTSDAGYIYTVPFSTTAINPQKFTDLSANSTVSPQNSNNITQNVPQVYPNPPTFSLPSYSQQ